MIELECVECGKILHIDPQFRGLSGRCNHCGGAVHVPRDAMTVAQRAALAAATEQESKATVDEDWKSDPATPKQLSYLADLGATPSMMRGITKGRASEMIEQLQEIRQLVEEDADEVSPRSKPKNSTLATRDRETAKAIQRQTDFQKNACGCLILFLTAPIWIPLLLAIIGSQ